MTTRRLVAILCMRLVLALTAAVVVAFLALRSAGAAQTQTGEEFWSATTTVDVD